MSFSIGYTGASFTNNQQFLSVATLKVMHHSDVHETNDHDGETQNLYFKMLMKKVPSYGITCLHVYRF